MTRKKIAAQTSIESSKDYIGREDLVYDIYDIITYKSNNIAIINDDGMGKTSLLNFINLREIREDIKYLDEESRHKTLIVKTNNPKPKDALDFLVTLIKCLVDELRYNIYIDEEIKMKCGLILEKDDNYTNEVELKTRLYDVFRLLFNEGVGVIYLMDDFDKMVNNFRDTEKNAASDNFSFLRDLANNPSLYRVNYIVTSRVPIEDISYSVDVSGLPGIFTQIYMDPLTDSEIEDYASRYFESSRMLILRDEHKMVKEISGGLPGVLNYVCFHLFNSKVEGSDITYDKLLELTVDSSRAIFESQWKACSLNEKVLLRYWSGGDEQDDTPEQFFEEITRKLIRRKIFNKDLEFKCSAFKKYISSRAKIDEENKEVEEINEKTLEPNQEDGDLKGDLIEAYKKIAELQREKINNLINELEKDENVQSYQEKITTDEEKINYNNYVLDMVNAYFDKGSNNINDFPYLADKSIAKYWDSLDVTLKDDLVAAEKLYAGYINTENDQSPVGTSYCNTIEGLIKTQVYSNIKIFILDKYPNFEIRYNKKDIMLETINEPMIGQFRTILDRYKRQSESDLRGNASSDPLIMLYTPRIIKKFEDFNSIRNRVSHGNTDEEGKVTKHEINKLKRLVYEGGESLFEILIKMSEIKYPTMGTGSLA